MRIRFITSTPLDVFRGSGTYVGIETLARTIREFGHTVDITVPHIFFPIYTVQRMMFNQWLRFRRKDTHDVTVGFDMDGYTIAGADPGIHVASIKGVIADEMRFESGITKMTMGVQASCEAQHIRRADMVITTSNYSAERIRQLYGASRPIQIVPELIDLAVWRNGSGAIGATATAKFIVLTVCRFYPRKRLHVLLAAVERLRSRIPQLELRIVGGGPEESHLKTLCRQRNLEDLVVWRHNISRAELAQEYQQCQVFCLPSVQEGFGIVFLEAMANGKPIVAVRASSTPEVVRHGLLAEPDNPRELADAIERLYKEPQLRRSLGEAGLVFVRQFDAPLVGNMFLRALEEFRDLRVRSAIPSTNDHSNKR